MKRYMKYLDNHYLLSYLIIFKLPLQTKFEFCDVAEMEVVWIKQSWHRKDVKYPEITAYINEKNKSKDSMMFHA